jgi:glycerol-3-phosphate O-acyltransferase
MLDALTSPAGKILGGAIAAVVFTIAVYTAGYRAHVTASKEAQYRAERDAAFRDLLISQQATKAAEDLADAAEIDTAEARKRADEYAKKLGKGDGADLTADDIKQLQHIRGGKRR